MNKTAGVWTKRHEKAIDKWLAAHPDHTDHMRWSEMPTELVDTLISIRNGDMMPAFAESYFRKQIDARRHGKVWGRSASAGMDNKRIAKELLKVAREIVAGIPPLHSKKLLQRSRDLIIAKEMMEAIEGVVRKHSNLSLQPHWNETRAHIDQIIEILNAVHYFD